MDERGLNDPASVVSSSDIRLLTEVGFVAAGQGWVDHARTIFEGLMRLRPAAAFPYLGLGLALINAGHPDEASSLLEKADGVLKDAATQAGADAMQASSLEGDRALLSAYHALALRYSGRLSDSARVLRNLADRPDPDAAGRIARGMLGLPLATENVG